MVKYKITRGIHYVYNYADKTWHDFDNISDAFSFMESVIGG